MLKKFSFFLFVFYLFGAFDYVSSDIIPQKKPAQTKEETKKKLLTDMLRPLPKPIEKSEVKKIEEKIIVKKDKKKQLILPKKKTFNSRH